MWWRRQVSMGSAPQSRCVSITTRISVTTAGIRAAPRELRSKLTATHASTSSTAASQPCGKPRLRRAIPSLQLLELGNRRQFRFLYQPFKTSSSANPSPNWSAVQTSTISPRIDAGCGSPISSNSLPALLALVVPIWFDCGYAGLESFGLNFDPMSVLSRARQ